MKNIIFIVTVLLSISCKSQIIIPVEQKEYYWDNESVEIPEGSKIKDVNNLLPKYVGVWKGTHDNKNFEFVIEEYTDYSSDPYAEIIEQDFLKMRYKITDNNGNIIENNLTPNIDVPEVTGRYLAETDAYYVLDYDGREFVCGQSGSIFIGILNNQPNKMQLNLTPTRDMLPVKDCPNGTATQIIPTDIITLTKQ